MTIKSLLNILFLLAIAVLISSCVYAKFHDYADNNQCIAEDTIKALKKDTLLVVIPTYQEKERILKSAISTSRTDRDDLEQRLLNLYAERQLELEAIVNAFEEYYSFSEVRYLPDSLVKPFESGAPNITFINSDFRPDHTISMHNRTPIKLIKQFDQDWQIKSGIKIIPNPFPNHYLYRNGLFGFLGSEPYDKMYRRVVEVFQLRFEKFYEDPKSRVRL